MLFSEPHTRPHSKSKLSDFFFHIEGYGGQAGGYGGQATKGNGNKYGKICYYCLKPYVIPRFVFVFPANGAAAAGNNGAAMKGYGKSIYYNSLATL